MFLSERILYILLLCHCLSSTLDFLDKLTTGYLFLLICKLSCFFLFLPRDMPICMVYILSTLVWKMMVTHMVCFFLTVMHRVCFLSFYTPFPNKPWFFHLCSTSLLKTLQEKEKLLVLSNFSFSHSVFYPFGKLSAIFIKSKIIICKLFQFDKV